MSIALDLVGKYTTGFLSQLGGLPGGRGGMSATLGGGLAQSYFEVGLAGLDGLVGDELDALATPTRSIEGRGGLKEMSFYRLLVRTKNYLGGLFGLKVLNVTLVSSEVYGR